MTPPTELDTLRAENAAKDAEIARLHSLAKANNQLARHEASGRKELQAANAAMREVLEKIELRLRHHPDDDAEDDKRDKRKGHALAKAALSQRDATQGEGHG